MVPLCTLFLVLACLSSSHIITAMKITADREKLIQSAIQELKTEVQDSTLSNSQGKLHAFKKATPEILAQGTASLKFERMVKLAENKIIQKQLQSSAQTTSAVAEALATQLLHRPGSILTETEIAEIFKQSGCRGTIPSPANCSTQFSSHHSPSGTCNNIANPTWGAAGTPLRRLIPASYDDGISRGRGFLQSQGSSLFGGAFSSPKPSPRTASTGIILDQGVEDNLHTHMLMQWGQFVDHDVTFTPEHEEDNCPNACKISNEDEGSCYPIAIPENDDALTVTLVDSNKCQKFFRSLGACPQGGQPTNQVFPREQINGITHFIDGSNVYSYSDDILNLELRDLLSDAGLLKTGAAATTGSQRPLLPDAGPSSFLQCPAGSEPCFLAGDSRVNEQSGLSIMHTLWLREHNRIAQFIKSNNPSYTSNEVFQVARRIVVAEMQKITYDYFVPILLGDSHTALIPQYKGYDSNTDPSIPNAFATAAYRFGHSQIQPQLARLDENYNPIPEGPLPLVDAFFNTSHVRKLGTDPILRGMLDGKARKVDEYLNSILTNQLFADDSKSHGMDLAALNIQRGRDHGLPGYLTWKQWAKATCGVESDFRTEVTHAKILEIYGDLDNVDLFVGGLAEKILPNGLVGAVFGCIIAKTFEALRDGDRFYYKNSDAVLALFTPEQRQELERASLSRVICDNTDINSIQPNAFLVNNARVSCSNIPAVDLHSWVAQDEGQENGPELPETCYIKIRSDRNAVYFSNSRSNDASDYTFSQKIVLAGNEACFSIQCPSQGGHNSFAVGNQDLNCAPNINPALPAALDSLPGTSFNYLAGVYIQQLDASIFLQGGSGLYTSSSSCEASSDIALSYDCAALQQADRSLIEQLKIMLENSE